ncbi:MAG: hypothetical protein KJ674_05420 [Nanoarchaeota archaeon]|nr:hypothetical protein [Nanoarchaeota archaeon]
MKKVLIILIFLILISNVDANSVTGYVFLEVINEPPEIISLSILEPYEDTNLFCDIKFKDEKDTIDLNYKWYKNNQLIENQNTEALSNEFYKKDDKITCSVLPHDGTQYGEQKNITTQILPINLKTKAQKTFLNLFSTEDITSKEIQQNSITGLAVSNIKANPTPLFNNIIYFLLIILFLIILVDIRKHLHFKSVS